MKKSKQRRRRDDVQTAIIAEPASGCGVDYAGSTRSDPVADPNHVAPKPAPRTKRLRALLSTDRGASLDEVCLAFVWQPQSTRAALSVLRKSGTAVERINFAVSDDETGSLAKGLTRYRFSLSDGTAS